MRDTPAGQRDRGWSTFDALTTTVATNFPKLKMLYISLLTNSFIADSSSRFVEADEAMLFTSVDRMVKHFGSTLQNCRIATPFTLHAGLLLRAKSIAALTEYRPDVFPASTRFWRSLPLEQNEQQSGDLGYWLERGMDDHPPGFHSILL